MSTTYAYSLTETFNVTHARHISAKVATDLLRFQRFYGRPTEPAIDAYEGELVVLLKYGYVETVMYGFLRRGLWVEALRYHAISGGTLVGDDDPGKLRPQADVSNASFTSYLTHSSAWWALSQEGRADFEATLPIRRTVGAEPGIEKGYWATDLTYSAGGRAIQRSTVRGF